MTSNPRRKEMQYAPPWEPSSGLTEESTAQGVFTDGYALPQMVEDLRKYQAELEVQNEALRYSSLPPKGPPSGSWHCSPTCHWH